MVALFIIILTVIIVIIPCIPAVTVFLSRSLTYLQRGIPRVTLMSKLDFFNLLTTKLVLSVSPILFDPALRHFVACIANCHSTFQSVLPNLADS